MKKTILVDGMFCIYDKEFNVNKHLLKIINSFDVNKILVVNGFMEKGRKTILGNGFEAFSLEEEGIKKNNPEYFKILMLRFNLRPEELLYFDYKEENVESAKGLGITAAQYKDDEQIKEFLEANL